MDVDDEATTFTHLNIQSITEKYKIYENDKQEKLITKNVKDSSKNEVDSFLESLARKYDIDLDATDDKTQRKKKNNKCSHSSDDDEKVSTVKNNIVGNISSASSIAKRHFEQLSSSDDDKSITKPTVKPLTSKSNNMLISDDDDYYETYNLSISDNDEIETELPTVQNYAQRNINHPSTSYDTSEVPTCSKNTKTNSFLSSDEEELETLTVTRPKKAKTKAVTSKEEKERAKIERQLDRERKKEETERQKEINKLIKATNKSLKPDQCIKFVTAQIDPSIIENFPQNGIAEAIGTLGANYKTERQLIPNSVTWIRKTDRHYLDDEGKFRAQSKTEQCDQLLIMYTTKDFLKLVDDNVLVAQVRDAEKIAGGKRISLGVFGMESYYRGKRKGEKLPKISRHVIEMALTELQIYSNVCYRFIDKVEEVGAMIAQFTKSVAQKPYKLEKHEKHKEAEWYMSGDNKDCVKVDKDGNGLRRLWQQQLTMFPMARIETAEAIMSVYPTLTSLFKAYDDCATEAEKERLVQDIQIRRAAGPLSNNRKIGPELSKKLYNVYNSLNGDTYL